MIVYDLRCEDSGDVFEAWFKSSADFEEQQGRGLVQCPVCQSTSIAKAPMAPRVPAKSSPYESPLAKLAAIQGEILKDSEWVGDRFAAEARAIHVGDAQVRPVHGNATAAEAKLLIDEGIPVAPLPFPVPDPGEEN